MDLAATHRLAGDHLPLGTLSQQPILLEVHNNPFFWKSAIVTDKVPADEVGAGEAEVIDADGPVLGCPGVFPDGVPSRVRYVCVPSFAGPLTESSFSAFTCAQISP